MSCFPSKFSKLYLNLGFAEATETWQQRLVMTPAEASPDDAGEAEELGHHVPQVGHPDEGQRFHN